MTHCSLPRTYAVLIVTTSFWLTPWAHAQNSVPQSNTLGIEERQLAEDGSAILRQRWADFIKDPKRAERLGETRRTRGTKLLTVPAADPGNETLLPAPQQQSLAIGSTAAYVEPDILRSKDGVLEFTMNAEYGDFKIGNDPVHLRTFNPGDKPSGKLVGPTLVLHPGDVLRIKLQNKLPGQRWRPNMMNTLNTFNTLNIHYHGLHVSPNGISDNVLILVGPHESQEYEVKIPKDHTTGTYWYHPHRHGSTAGDVASGMSGALIIEAREGQPSLDNLPEIKTADQRVMVLNQIPYIYKNSFPTPLPAVQIDLKVGVVEEKYAGYMFGPGDWGKLGRFTTVNGVQLPVLKMRPGQVDRWRFVDSGQRESMLLRILPVNAGKIPLNFQEIAVDGLALGKMIEKDSLELWPGYRSDVLVKAPDEPGEYLIVDGPKTTDGTTKPMSYVARLSINGEPKPMKLPRSDAMTRLRLPSIPDNAITGQQSASYGILIVGGNPVFTIDGKSFDMETARKLYLNDTDEWTIHSSNQVGPVTHPFHIHVNPFEVTSIMAPVYDENGNEVMAGGSPKLVEQLTDGPVWRDTVKIPGDGYVTMRTHYSDYIGTFVQHCHILDHEDQGMMQLIDIVAKKSKPTAGLLPRTGSVAADFKLPDANGEMHTLREVQGKPTIVFFFKGHGCLHCVQQMTAFTDHYQEFQRKGIQLIGVTSDTGDALKRALQDFPCPFTLLADPTGVAFASYGCSTADGLQHGTFTLDASHKITWGTVGASPFLAVTELLKDSPPPVNAEGKQKPIENTQAALFQKN